MRIQGGRPLAGTVRASGRKNAALPLMAATLLTTGPSTLDNVPAIRDVFAFCEMLRLLGADAEYQPAEHRLYVNPSDAAPAPIPHRLARSMRASYYLVGVQLARFGRAEVPLPGGDRIGQRPVDQHLKALRALGAEITVEQGCIRARAERLHGADIYLDLVSVGATIHTMLAAVLAEGTTVVHNAAREPHVVDVAQFLNACGADITGAGTDAIRVRGAGALCGTAHTVISDDIDAATFLIAAAITGGDVTVQQVIPHHLQPIMAKLREAGARVESNGNWVRVTAAGRPRGLQVTTLPYPGFPTDAQSQMMALLALARGQSRVTETLYEDRFRFVPELVRMGAQLRVEGRSTLITGVSRLDGCPVEATDIRAGAALILAGLGGRGTTTVHGIAHVERGYENLAGRLRALGADIAREDD